MFIVDYNSWQESEKGLRLAASLDKNVVLAEGVIRVKSNLCNQMCLIISQVTKNTTLAGHI